MGFSSYHNKRKASPMVLFSSTEYPVGDYIRYSFGVDDGDGKGGVGR